MEELLEQQLEPIRWIYDLTQKNGGLVTTETTTVGKLTDVVCQSEDTLKAAFHQTSRNIKELQLGGGIVSDVYLLYNDCVYILPIDGNLRMQVKGRIAKDVKRLIRERLR